MFTLLSSVYRKRIIGKQARVVWSIGVIGAVVLLATVGPSESDAAGLGETREYGACMRLARVSPTEGFETALSWSDAGGGGEPSGPSCADGVVRALAPGLGGGGEGEGGETSERS